MTGAHLDTLSAIADRFMALRTRPPDLAGAAAAAFAAVAGTDRSPDLPLLRAAGAKLAEEIDKAAGDAAAKGRGEPPYHNRYHFAETVLAMGWLCSLAREQRLVSAPLATLGVIAMIGHDWHHDGSLPNWRQTGSRRGDGRAGGGCAAAEFRLRGGACGDPEHRSWAGGGECRARRRPAAGRAAGAGGGCVVQPRERGRCVRQLPAGAGVAAGRGARGRMARTVLPRANCRDDAGRLAFCAPTVNCCSAPATRLGLTELRDRQVDAFARVAARLHAGTARR